MKNRPYSSLARVHHRLCVVVQDGAARVLSIFEFPMIFVNATYCEYPLRNLCLARGTSRDLHLRRLLPTSQSFALPFPLASPVSLFPSIRIDCCER